MHSPSAERRAAVWHALGVVGLALEVEPPTALELLRATARATDSTVDDVAADLLDGRLVPAALHAPERAPRD
jgi:hypothetical protein